MLSPKYRDEFPKVIEVFIKKYIQTSGASGCVVGLSGGLDSTVVMKLAVDSIGPENVLGILMPETTTPPSNMSDIADYAEKLGVETRTIDISGLVERFKADLKDAGHNLEIAGQKSLGNVKARVRMTILFHVALEENKLVLGTSNKSELLTGYFTKYGDGGADISPIGDLYKTQVLELARAIDVPGHFIERVPSGDLWEGQSDEEELGITYGELDSILIGIELGLTDEEISERAEAGAEKIARVRKLVHNSVHKRRLGLIPKLGVRTVGLDWREA